MRQAVNSLCRHDNSRGSLFESSRVRVSTSSHDNDPCYPEQSTESKPRSRDWTCFLADRESTNGVRSTGGSRQPREWTSPVYSLSSPSLYSPTFFAGVEGHVIQVDVADAYDRFPDPIYKYGPESTGKRDRDATRKWDPESNIMCVNAYQHVHTNIEMMHQTRIGERKPGDQMPGLRRGEVPLPPGWDERWYSKHR